MIASLAALVLAAGRIKHVVVLYEENRAFDHFFGHQKALKVDGLKGNETNPIDYKHPSKGSVKVFDGAPYVAKEQPRHGYSAYQTKFDIVDGYPRGRFCGRALGAPTIAQDGRRRNAGLHRRRFAHFDRFGLRVCRLR